MRIPPVQVNRGRFQTDARFDEPRNLKQAAREIIVPIISALAGPIRGRPQRLDAADGFIVAIVTIFKKQWSAITAPIYALLEGLVLGGVSALLEMRFHGIAIQAVALTLGVLIAMLVAYRTGLIKVTDKLRLGIVAATGGIAVFYFLQFILGFFGIHFTTIKGATPIGIGFSVLVVAIAALNLVLDFDLIENGARYGAPKYMEWYSAFALMITLVWLYFEILRLLSKIRER